MKITIFIIAVFFVCTFTLSTEAQTDHRKHIHYLEVSHSFSFTKMNKIGHFAAPIGLTYYFGKEARPFALSIIYTSAETVGYLNPSNRFDGLAYGLHYTPWTSTQTGRWTSQLQVGVSAAKYHITNRDRNNMLTNEGWVSRPIVAHSTKQVISIPISYRLKFHPNQHVGMTFGLNIIPSFNKVFSFGIMIGMDVGRTRISAPITEP